MENRSHALAAGLFTLILGVGLALVAFWFSKDDGAGLVPYLVVTDGNVAGLKTEAPVRYRGVDVGRVDSIRLDTKARGRVLVGISLQKDTPISKSTVAQLGYLGITGLAFVSLSDDGQSAELIKSSRADVATIRMKPSVLDSGEDLLTNLAEMVEHLSELVDEDMKAKIKRTMANVERTRERTAIALEKLVPGLVQMPSLVSEARAAIGEARSSVAQIKGALSSVQGAVATVQGTVSTLAGKADQLIGNLNALALKLDNRVDVLNKVADSVEEVGATARAVQEVTLPRVNSLADEVSRHAKVLSRVVQDLGDQPHSFVYGTPAPRPGPGEAGFSAGSAK